MAKLDPKDTSIAFIVGKLTKKDKVLIFDSLQIYLYNHEEKNTQHDLYYTIVNKKEYNKISFLNSEIVKRAVQMNLGTHRQWLKNVLERSHADYSRNEKRTERLEKIGDLISSIKLNISKE